MLTALSFIFFWQSSLYAQGIVDVEVEVESALTNRVKARKDLFKSAIENISNKYIQEIIGEDKLQRNRRVIRNKIIRHSGKYILFMKGVDFKKTKSGSKMLVLMKVNIHNLKTLLLNEGLFYKIGGPARVLPLISFVDHQKSQNYSWWVHKYASGRNVMIDVGQNLHDGLAEQLYKRGFFSFKPIRHKLESVIPLAFRVENLQTVDYLFLGQYYNASIVLRGSLVLQEGQRSQGPLIRAKIQALHSGNGRIVGEVIREYRVKAGANSSSQLKRRMTEVSEQLSEGLAVQLHDAWKRGTFGADLIQLTIKGPLAYRQLEQLKKLVLERVKDIKSLKERLFKPGEVTFEIDSLSNTKNLAKNFNGQKFPRFKVKVESVETDRLALSVKAW